MISDLEKLLEREQFKIDPNKIPKISVRSVDDIKKVLYEYDPKNSKSMTDVDIVTYMSAVEEGKNVTYKVETTTKSKSKRDMIIDGLDVVKNHKIDENIEQIGVVVNGKEMKPAKIGDGIKAKCWIDPLIKQWFDGYREDVYICWNIKGYKYRYDIYEHKLERTQL